VARSDAPDVKDALALALRELRRESGLTSTSVAEAIGTNREQLSRWENGTHTPSAASLLALAAVYEADVASMVAPALDHARKAIKKPRQGRKR
jgi:transcriptional regulator with XRE-family HTH domain